MVPSKNNSLSMPEATISPLGYPLLGAHEQCSILAIDPSQPLPLGFQPYYRAFWELFWIADGTATHCTEAGKVTLGAGTLLFVHAGQTHWWAPFTCFSGWAIAFTRDLLELESPQSAGWTRFPFLSPSTKTVAIEVSAERRSGIADLCARMAAEGKQVHPFRNTVLRACLELIVIEAGRHISPARTTLASLSAHITGDFLDLVALHYKTKHRTQDYAELLNHSVYALSQHIWSHTGKTPACLIRERRLGEARRLLTHSQLNVSEIAYELGFKSPSNFGRFFRKYTGQTPGDSRSSPAPERQSIQPRRKNGQKKSENEQITRLPD